MALKHLGTVVSAAVLWAASLYSCSSPPPSAGNTNAGATQLGTSQGGSTSGVPSQAGGSGTVASPYRTTLKPGVANQTAAGVTPAADQWCASASKTGIVRVAGLAPLFSQMCVNGQATQLLANILVQTAYNGSGSPNLQMISPIADANGSVAATFGVGIHIPITSKTQFDVVAPEQGQVAHIAALATAQGATPGAISATQLAAKSDPGFIRGWSINNASSSTPFPLITIQTIYQSETDQYSFGGGLYMYVSTLTQSVQTMQNYQQLTASFDLGGTGYLLTVAQIQADDHGHPDVATQTVASTAGNLINFMYQSSAAAAGH